MTIKNSLCCFLNFFNLVLKLEWAHQCLDRINFEIRSVIRIDINHIVFKTRRYDLFPVVFDIGFTHDGAGITHADICASGIRAHSAARSHSLDWASLWLEAWKTCVFAHNGVAVGVSASWFAVRAINAIFLHAKHLFDFFVLIRKLMWLRHTHECRSLRLLKTVNILARTSHCVCFNSEFGALRIRSETRLTHAHWLIICRYKRLRWHNPSLYRLAWYRARDNSANLLIGQFGLFLIWILVEFFIRLILWIALFIIFIICWVLMEQIMEHSSRASPFACLKPLHNGLFIRYEFTVRFLVLSSLRPLQSNLGKLLILSGSNIIHDLSELSPKFEIVRFDLISEVLRIMHIFISDGFVSAFGDAFFHHDFFIRVILFLFDAKLLNPQTELFLEVLHGWCFFRFFFLFHPIESSIEFVFFIASLLVYPLEWFFDLWDFFIFTHS